MEPLIPIMGFGKDHTGTIIREVVQDEGVGALASKDAVKITGPILQEDFRLLKSEFTAIMNGLTAGEGAGLIIGIANGELSAAEIEEALEVGGPLDLNDRVGSERAMRNVKVLGATQVPAGVANTELQFVNEHGGPIIVSKHRWTYSNPEGWSWWIYNQGGSLTTGATLQLLCTHYGVWVV